MEQVCLLLLEQFAFTYLANGEETIDADGIKITDKFYINLGREANGPVVLPAYKKHLTFVKGAYQAATTFLLILLSEL